MAASGTGHARRKARTLALQALYEADTSGHAGAAAIDRLLEETPLPPANSEFARDLVVRVLDHRGEIDERMARAAPTWPLGQMSCVDRNILRIAIAEILFDNKVPLKAAINEAIELAKTFGSENSARFVNGVLGAVAAGSGSVAPTDSPQEAT